MSKSWRLIILFSTLFWGLAACRYLPIPYEIPREVTAEPSPTPAHCTGWPEGMKIRVAPRANSSISLELEGFQPGESLIFLFTGEIPGKSSARLEVQSTAGVGVDGRFTETISLYTTPQINQWQGKVIHARGTACFEITLPLSASPIEFPGTPTAVPEVTALPDDLYLPPKEPASQPTRTPIPTPTPYVLPTQSPPAGLIYGDSDGLWKVVVDGELQRLWTHGNVAMSPNGQRALYQDDREIQIADFAIGKESNLDLSFFSQWCCAVWGGDEMILLGTLPEGEEWQQSFGHLTAVAADGSWQRILDSESKYGTHPALSPDGRTIAYGAARLVQLDGQVTIFDPTQFAGFPNVENIGLGSPAWSPDGTKLAWYIAGSIGEDGSHAAAVAVFDLEAETAVIIHPYENLGRGGWFAAPVWSPDGQWIAFIAEDSDLAQDGIWVAAADGSEEHFLGGYGQPGKGLIWSPDGQYLIYSVWNLSEKRDVILMAEIGTWTTVPLNLPPDTIIVHWTADELPAVPPPLPFYCPDLQIDAMVGTFVQNDLNTTYTNPVLGIELTAPNKLCVHEPDYLFDSYGFSLSDPEAWAGGLLSVEWLYQATPAQLEAIVQEVMNDFSDLNVNREAITIDGKNGVALWPLPGTETTTHIFLVANDRLYQLIFWSAPLDDLAQMLLDGLRFIEPTQSLDSLDLPAADSSTFISPTAVPANQSTIQSGQPILFARDNDLWRTDSNGLNEQQLTKGAMLADWGIDKLPTFDPWWAGGFPPQVHVSPDGRWLAFTQTGKNLVLVDLTGQESPRYVEPGAPIVAWSPDSRYLAYHVAEQFPGFNFPSGIFLYDLLTDSTHQLLDENGANLVWSPDGSFLAFACCFNLNLDVEPSPGEVRRLELATKHVTTVGETWLGIASGSPPICWSADGAVGIDLSEPVTCSHERPYPANPSPDSEQQAYFSLRSPDDAEYFRLLVVKERASDAILWERETPLVQRVYWSPDGDYLILGNDYFAEDAVIWRIPADGSGEAEILISDARLINIIPAWQ